MSDYDREAECRRAIARLAGRPVSPVTWRKDGLPPVGAEIFFAGAHIMGVGRVDSETPPMPPGMWWCPASEARKALGLEEPT